MGAIDCPCQKKVKWNNTIGRGRNDYEKWIRVNIKGFKR